jgi:hypothetical protein
VRKTGGAAPQGSSQPIENNLIVDLENEKS